MVRKEKFITNILDNWDKIMQEYNALKIKTIPMYDFDDKPKYTPEWRAVTLWWNYKPLKPYQKRIF